MEFSPDGKRLITIGGVEWQNRPATELKVCDAQTGQELRNFRLDGDVSYTVLSSDGQRLASGSDRDKKVTIWDTQTAQKILALECGVKELVFSPDGKRLASQPEKGEVKLWDAQTGQQLPTFKGPTAEINALAFSRDGHRLACAFEDKDKTVKVWDAQSGQQLLTLKDTEWVYGLAFSPDGKRLLSASGFADYGAGRDDHAVVKIWDIQTRQELLSVQEESKFTCLALSPDGKRIATAEANETRPRMKLRDAQTGQLIFKFQGHTSRIKTMAFSSDSEHLASSSEDGTLRIWDLKAGEEIRTLRGHAAHTLAAHRLVFSPDGKRLASARQFQGVKVWDAQKEPEGLSLKGIFGLSYLNADNDLRDPYLVFSQDLRHVVGILPGAVKVWNARTGQETLTIKGHTDLVRSAAFSRDGKYLASGDGKHPFGSDGRPIPTHGVVKIWDGKTGHELHTLKGHITPVWCDAFSPDGKRLASVSEDRMVKVWDRQTGQELFSTPKEPQFRVWMSFSLAFSPDGKRLAGLAGQDVKLWDAQTGKEELKIQVGSWYIASLTFSPDGKRLAGVSGNPWAWSPRSVKVWDAQTRKELLSLTGQTGYCSLAFSPDGKRLATVSRDLLKLWDAQTGQELLSLHGHTELGGSVAFSPDGRRLGMVSTQGTVKFWDAPQPPEKP
jgi:WD40 repeat protein